MTGGRSSCTFCGNRPTCCHLYGAGSSSVLFSTDSRLAKYGCRGRSSARSCQAETILVPRMIRHRRGRTICGNANANVSSASVGRNASSCGFSRSRSGRVIDSDRGTRLLYGIGPGDPNASCFGKGPPILAGSRCDRHGRRHLVHAFRRYAGLQPAWDRDLVRSIPDSPLACHSDRRRRCRLCRRRTTPTGAPRIRLRDGLGISGMHYTGMAAMRMAALMEYDPRWVVLSILIAISASVIALWLAFRNTNAVQRLFAGLVMGLAVSGMHYAAMEGAMFLPTNTMAWQAGHLGVGQAPLAFLLAGITIVILSIGIAAAVYDRASAERAQREADALRRSEERFRLLVEGIVDHAIFMLGPDGRVGNWNLGAH